MTKTYIFDLEWLVHEGQDIVLDAQSVHCAVFKELGKEGFTEFYGASLSDLKNWLEASSYDCYIGHNILTSDLEVMRRLLDIPFTVGPDTIAGKPCTFIDTLTISRRQFPDRPGTYYQGKMMKGSHGLANWGIRTGISKPVVHDWVSQPVEVYLHRCREDVLNNEATYNMLLEENDATV